MLSWLSRWNSLESFSCTLCVHIQCIFFKCGYLTSDYRHELKILIAPQAYPEVSACKVQSEKINPHASYNINCLYYFNRNFPFMTSQASPTPSRINKNRLLSLTETSTNASHILMQTHTTTQKLATIFAFRLPFNYLLPLRFLILKSSILWKSWHPLVVTS